MGARGSKAIARAYRLTTRTPSAAADEPVEVRPGLTVPRFVHEWSRTGPAEAETFLQRLPDSVRFAGQSTLVVGRGAGDVGLAVLDRRVRRVVAMEMAGARVELAQERLNDEREGREVPLDITPFRGHVGELPEGPFDVALATQAFRRYGAGPSSPYLEELIAAIASRLAPGGLLAIEWGPFWKAPYGGAIDSRLPWAHLVFPEGVIFEEYRRVRAHSDARSFASLGISRITLRRFRRAMGDCGLEPVWSETNLGPGRAIQAMRALSRIPGLEEYFAQNVYGVWRRTRAGLRSSLPR